jgi:hypothetical protein
VRALKASAGKTIVTDGSSQLVHTLFENVYPLALGSGKRVFPATGIDRRLALAKATPYPTGVVGLHYTRAA